MKFQITDLDYLGDLSLENSHLMTGGSDYLADPKDKEPKEQCLPYGLAKKLADEHYELPAGWQKKDWVICESPSDYSSY